jgi:hypothetical protein
METCCVFFAVWTEFLNTYYLDDIRLQRVNCDEVLRKSYCVMLRGEWNFWSPGAVFRFASALNDIQCCVFFLQKASASQGAVDPFSFTVPPHGGQAVVFYPPQAPGPVDSSEMGSFLYWLRTPTSTASGQRGNLAVPYTSCVQPHNVTIVHVIIDSEWALSLVWCILGFRRVKPY